MGVRIVLEEIGVDYALIDVPIGRHEVRDPDHLRLNPNGWVPVLAWQDRAMYEAAAILIYLADRYAEARLAPAFDNPVRPRFLQTMVYLSNTVQTAFQQHYYPERFACDPTDHARTRARAAVRLHEVWQVIDRQIGNAPWVLGDEFSVVDAHLYTLSTWFDPDAGHPVLEAMPNVARVVKNVSQRDSVKNTPGL